MSPVPNKASSSTTKSRRRTTHVSRACNACRARRMRCDGCQPSCSACKLYGEDCTYNFDQDKRRSSDKTYVKDLEGRLQRLESMLGRQTRQVEGYTPDARHADSIASETPSDRGSLSNAGPDRLKVDDDTGELREYGPTSVFGQFPPPQRGPTNLSATETSAAFQQAGLMGPPDHAHRVLATLSAPEMDPFTHSEILRVFFQYFDPWCNWVDEVRFRRDMDASLAFPGTVVRPRRTAFYGPLLHNVILAFGVVLLGEPDPRRDRLGRAFAKRAKDLLEDEAEAPMLSTIAGILLLGSFESGSGRQSVGYVYAGIALRLVQALGLGINCSYWVHKGLISEETKMARDRLFYTAYIQDKLWSFYVGRSASVAILKEETSIPPPDPVEDDLAWCAVVSDPAPPMPPTLPPDASELEYMKDAAINSATRANQPIKGWRSSTFHWTCRLALIAEKVLSTVYSVGFSSKAPDVQEIVSDLDSALDRWYQALPPYLSISRAERPDYPSTPSHVLTLHATHHFIVILLYRPWYGRNPGGVTEGLAARAVSKCDDATSQLLSILSAYSHCPGLKYVPIAFIQITFTAGTTCLLRAAKGNNDSQEKRSASVDGVKTCIRALDSMAQTFKAAQQSGYILKRLLAEWSSSQAPEPQAWSEGTDTGSNASGPLRMDPLLAEQLQQMGWTPPAVPRTSGLATSPFSTMAMPPSNMAQQSPGLDWNLLSQFALHHTGMPAGGGAEPAAPSIYDSIFGSQATNNDQSPVTNNSYWPFGPAGGFGA